jgi:molybdopterin converting factor small subunit
LATVFIPAQLRVLTGGRDRLDAPGATVGELVDAIDVAYPGFRARVVEDGELARSLAVSVDGDLTPAGLREAVAAEAEVHFVPALGGGT